MVDPMLPRWILNLGALRRILSYHAANFQLAQVENVCALFRIVKLLTIAYHPAGNGACARFNQTIKRGLQRGLHGKYLGHCDVALIEEMFSYNTSVHTTASFTPQFLLFG